MTEPKTPALIVEKLMLEAKKACEAQQYQSATKHIKQCIEKVTTESRLEASLTRQDVEQHLTTLNQALVKEKPKTAEDAFTKGYVQQTTYNLYHDHLRTSPQPRPEPRPKVVEELQQDNDFVKSVKQREEYEELCSRAKKEFNEKKEQPELRAGNALLASEQEVVNFVNRVVDNAHNEMGITKLGPTTAVILNASLHGELNATIHDIKSKLDTDQQHYIAGKIEEDTLARLKSTTDDLFSQNRINQKEYDTLTKQRNKINNQLKEMQKKAPKPASPHRHSPFSTRPTPRGAPKK